MSGKTPEIDYEREDWDRIVEDIQSLKQQVLSKIIQSGKRELLAWYEKRLISFLDEAKAELGGLSSVEGVGRFVAFHTLVESTTDIEISPRLDMPPPHSIMDFLNSVLQELENPEELLAKL